MLTSCGKDNQKGSAIAGSSDRLTATVSSPISSDKADASSADSANESSDSSSAETGSDDESSSMQSTVSNSEPEPCRHKSTYVKNKIDATESAEGYTGDTYCSDCGTLVSKGKTVQKITSNPPAPSSQSPSASDMNKYEQEMFCQLNEMRAKAGVEAIKWNDEVYKYTKIRANETIDYFKRGQVGHNGNPHNRMYNGKWDSPFTVFEEYGYPDGMTMGENIAFMQIGSKSGDYIKQVTKLMEGLYNSQGHRENMLNRNFTTVAIAFVDFTDQIGYNCILAVQMFYTPKN